MAVTAVKPRKLWENRFETPTWDELTEVLPKHAAALLEYARERLAAVDGTRESLGWQGVWCWTLVIRHPRAEDRGLAYLVPDPSRPRVCIPVANALIPQLPVKKLSRFVRDGLLHAPAVDQVRWACWSIQARAHVDELMTLVGYKVNPPIPAAPPGAAAKA